MYMMMIRNNHTEIKAEVHSQGCKARVQTQFQLKLVFTGLGIGPEPGLGIGPEQKVPNLECALD